MNYYESNYAICFILHYVYLQLTKPQKSNSIDPSNFAPRVFSLQGRENPEKKVEDVNCRLQVRLASNCFIIAETIQTFTPANIRPKK